MLAKIIFLALVCVLSVSAAPSNNTEFEKLDIFNALAKCTEENCSKESAAFVAAVKESEKNDPKFEETLKKCKECMVKKYEEMTVEEKKELKNCLTKNDCKAKGKIFEKYKEKKEAKDLGVCLKAKCPKELEAMLALKKNGGSVEETATMATV